MMPAFRPIKQQRSPVKVEAKVQFANDFKMKKDESAGRKSVAVILSLIIHGAILAIKFPEVVINENKKEKLAAIKMEFITPPESYKKQKEKQIFTKKEIAKAMTQTDPGVKVVTTQEKGVTGDPKAEVKSKIQKSKAGSAKNGPLSSPNAVGATGLGDSSTKGYEFKGKGLKALMGDSSKISLPTGGSSSDSKGTIIGSGIANKGSNLAGEYRAPAGMGDGSGHLLGKDAVGNYDRSVSARGLANKKGIDTAFVQADTVIVGSIEPELLRKILQEYLPQFRFCYQQELQEHSEKIKGIIDLNFRIEGDGKVSTVNIKNAQTRFSDKGINCMSNILRIIEFPKPKGGGLVDVRQPLNFQSENTKI